VLTGGLARGGVGFFQWGNAEKALKDPSTAWSGFFIAFSPSLRQTCEFAFSSDRISRH
jgi:hypothetical protein